LKCFCDWIQISKALHFLDLSIIVKLSSYSQSFRIQITQKLYYQAYWKIWQNCNVVADGDDILWLWTEKAGLTCPKKFKSPTLAISSFKKVHYSKMKKGQIFFTILLKWKDSKLEFQKIASFVQICPKKAFKYTFFFNIQKGQKMAKWSNYFISGKQFQKRPNGNPDSYALFEWPLSPLTSKCNLNCESWYLLLELFSNDTCQLLAHFSWHFLSY